VADGNVGMTQQREEQTALRGFKVALMVGLLGPVGFSGAATAAYDANRTAGGTLSRTYDQLLVDCVYGSNPHDACAELEAAGFAASTNYGLGNSLTQAPIDALRSDCDKPFVATVKHAACSGRRRRCR